MATARGYHMARLTNPVTLFQLAAVWLLSRKRGNMQMWGTRSHAEHLSHPMWRGGHCQSLSPYRAVFSGLLGLNFRVMMGVCRQAMNQVHKDQDFQGEARTGDNGWCVLAGRP